MLTKTTEVYASGQIELECDVYAPDDCPHDSPALLYFHPGGLVDWGRDCIPPWLVQVCFQRRWPLISPSYCLLPQASAEILLKDAEAAYNFARNWNTHGNPPRPVIVSGASGGFFLAATLTHHCQPPPLALLSTQGINTFRHPFFNSSTQLTPNLVSEADLIRLSSEPLGIGTTPPGAKSAFRLDKLRPDGSKNPDYVYPTPPAGQTDRQASRDELYDLFIYHNSWLQMVGGIDLGYEWARPGDGGTRSQDAMDRVARWPPTVVYHGNKDEDVPLDVSVQMRDALGADKVSLYVADGQPHLYDLTKFIEDDLPGMDTVRAAVKRLDDIVASTTSQA